MPGLLRGVARTAAIAGTATAARNRVNKRQSERWAAQEAAEDPRQPMAESQPSAAVTQESPIEQLRTWPMWASPEVKGGVLKT